VKTTERTIGDKIEDVVTCESFLREALEAECNGIATFPTVQDYARAYKTKKITPLDVAHNVINNIKQSNKHEKPLCAFIASNDKDILEQARKSTALYNLGKPRSILEGVPICIKDEFDQCGYATSVGTAYLQKVAQRDATVVKRFRDLGAILVGKTNMHEIGISTLGFNSHHGTTRNPYDLNRYCGGSSSGSAAAVATGICPIAVGADGGGSIRVPAGLSGAVGLKPTYGRVSEFGAFELCWSVAHAGPIATCVQDCAIGYAVMCGPDPLDENTFPQPLPKVPRLSTISGSLPLKGLRIGIYDPWCDHATPEMVAAYKGVVDMMCSMGASKKQVTILGELLEYSRVAHSIIITSEMFTAISPYYQGKERAAMGLDVRATLAVARHGKSAEYIQANRIRTMAIERLKELFNEIDVIVTPNTGTEAPRMASPTGEMNLGVVGELMRFAFLANLTGLPGTLPVPFKKCSERFFNKKG
jgi:Asp-tRNA(Asn)/Glu-tRNA(Gln) amidotransferase A subunit family amidase